MFKLSKKSLLLVMLLLVLSIFLVGPEIVHADDYDIALTTYVPTASVANATADIAGNIKIDKIILSNNGDANQTVTIYDLAVSSLTATSRMVVDVSSNTVHTVPVIIDYPYHNPMKVTDFAIRKSTTTSGINAYILYR